MTAMYRRSPPRVTESSVDARDERLAPECKGEASRDGASYAASTRVQRVSSDRRTLAAWIVPRPMCRSAMLSLVLRSIRHLSPAPARMSALQFVVEGGHTLSGTIRPSGNKNAALPIVCGGAAHRASGHPRERPAHSRRRDARRADCVDRRRRRVDRAQHAAHSREDGDGRAARSGALQEDSRVDPARRAAARALRRDRAAAAGRRRDRPAARRHALPRARAARRARSSSTRASSLSTPGLRGADVFLDEPSVTGTENALMAAVAATGTTILRNAASEPHVQDLCHFLVALGAEIDGIGTNKLTINGGRPLRRRDASDRSRSHRGRLVHRARRGHRLGDPHRGRRRRAPALHAHGLRAARRLVRRSTAPTSSSRPSRRR